MKLNVSRLVEWICLRANLDFSSSWVDHFLMPTEKIQSQTIVSSSSFLTKSWKASNKLLLSGFQKEKTTESSVIMMLKREKVLWIVKRKAELETSPRLMCLWFSQITLSNNTLTHIQNSYIRENTTTQQVPYSICHLDRKIDTRYMYSRKTVIR